MAGRLEGRTAVITGAGRGIGRAVALAMAAQGARVVVNDLGTSMVGEGASPTPAEETCALIRAAGGEAAPSFDSVAEWASARRIVETAMDVFGRIDVVVNNAGIGGGAPFHEFDPERWVALRSVHLDGAFYVSRAAAPHFRAQGSGAYVHMTSSAGVLGYRGQVGYATAKAGVIGLSKSIALDMAPHGVRSNCIAPVADTRMSTFAVRTPELTAAMALLTPEQNAPLAVVLASDLGREVNGQVFLVRRNEIFLAHQMDAPRSVHRGDGWTVETIAEHALPALAPGFSPLTAANDVMNWPTI